MNNVVENGLLLTIASTFVTYGVITLYVEPIYGIIALLLGAGTYVLRGYLQNKGYNVGAIGGAKKKKK